VISFAVNCFALFFKAWFYLLAGILILCFSIKKKLFHRNICMALSSSSILYILSYAIGNLASSYRFIYWSVFATIIASVLIGLDLYQKIKSEKIVNQIT
jgi:hydrogenase-4 membrane subunit HyfE